VLPNPGNKDYIIRYVDGDNEEINVSDDEDLAAAYDVAQKDLNGNLKFVVQFKKPLHQSATIAPEISDKKAKKEKKDKKEKEKKEKKEKEKLEKKKAKTVKKAAKKMPEEEFEDLVPRESRADTLAQP